MNISLREREKDREIDLQLQMNNLQESFIIQARIYRIFAFEHNSFSHGFRIG